MMIKSCHDLDLEAIKQHEIYSQRGKELNRLCRLSFEEKLKKSHEIIQEALSTHSKPVVACSFGKDSVTVLYMVHEVDNAVPAVFTDTGVEFPETKNYIKKLEREWDLKVFILKPERTFWDIVEEYGYPNEKRGARASDKRATTREPKCCLILKRLPMIKFISEYKPDIVFTGLTSGEGMGRRVIFLRKGNFIYRHESEGVDRCVPLLFWYPEEVFKYLELKGIPLNPAYKKYQIERMGCIPCTGYIGWEKQLARLFPSLYKKVQHEKGQYLIADFE
jgi:phosphoadenosine phosphosulfate reductase